MSLPTILVTSATGRIGKELIARLSKDRAFIIRAASFSGGNAGDNDRDILDLLACYLQRILEPSEGDDGGSVLIIVEDRDVQPALQLLFDVERAWCGDVFKVHTAEGGSEAHDRFDDLVRVFRIEADRKGIDLAELFKQERLAFHDRHGGFGANVAEAKDRSAVAHDGDGVFANG